MVGKSCDEVLPALSINGVLIAWANSMRLFGVNFVLEIKH